MKKLPPCVGCKERTQTCHDACKTYKAWYADMRAEKLALQKDNDMAMIANKSHAASVRRSKSGKGKKWTSS